LKSFEIQLVFASGRNILFVKPLNVVLKTGEAVGLFALLMVCCDYKHFYDYKQQIKTGSELSAILRCFLAKKEKKCGNKLHFAC